MRWICAHSGQSVSLCRNDAPITMPIATPLASQTPMCPAISPNTAPSAAPSAIPNPCSFDLFVITVLLPSGSRPSMLLKPKAGSRLADPSLRLRLIAGLQRFVPDLPHLAQQLRQRHARERLEQCRHLRRHLGDVARDFAHPRPVAISGGDDGDLVDVGQRSG